VKALVLAAVTTSLLVAGCGAHDACVARGTSSDYQGSVVFSGSVAGATNTTTTVVDFTPSCSYPSMEFLVKTQSCSLWFTLAGVRYDDGKHGSGKFLEGSAYIVPDQWCTFRAGDQTLAAQVTDGNLVFTGDQVIDLNVTAAGVGGHVQWSTHGAISP